MAKSKNIKVEKSETENGVFERNQTLIENAMLGYLKDHSNFPTYVELAELTGLTRETCMNHCKTFDWNKYLPKYNPYKPTLLKHILNAAQRNPSSQRLAAQIFGMVDGEQSINLNINVNLPDFLK